MATFVMLTRLSAEAVKSPADVTRLETAVDRRIRKECPEVKWKANLAILGPCDYLDIFEAPDEVVAAKVAMIVRSFGHAQTETWTALAWDRYKKLISA
jgi:uncharacterized protein with GYD domain